MLTRTSSQGALRRSRRCGGGLASASRPASRHSPTITNMAISSAGKPTISIRSVALGERGEHEADLRDAGDDARLLACRGA